MIVFLLIPAGTAFHIPNVASLIWKIGKALTADTRISVGMQTQIFLDNYYHKSNEIIGSIGKL